VDELGKVNVGIVNALVKLTQSGLIKWCFKTFTESSSEAYVSEGSTLVRFCTTVHDREIDLSVIDNYPKYLRLENITILTSEEHLRELTISPLVALFRAIEGTKGNLEIQLREDYLMCLNKMINDA